MPLTPAERERLDGMEEEHRALKVVLFGNAPKQYDGDDGVIGQIMRGQAKVQAQLKAATYALATTALALVANIMLSIFKVKLGG